MSALPDLSVEEAARALLLRLLRYQRRFKLSARRLGQELGFGERSIRRWVAAGAVSRKARERVAEYLAAKLGGRRCGREISALEICALMRRERGGSAVMNRQDLGYLAVWLLCHLQELGVDALPSFATAGGPQMTQLVTRDQADFPTRSVTFLLRGRRPYYQSHSHRAGLAAKLEFEGVVDPSGLEFCLEFLSREHKRPALRKAAVRDKMLKELHRYNGTKTL